MNEPRDAEPLRIDLPEGGSVSALLDGAADARQALVLAHGAGAGMSHPFMAALAGGLAGRGIACLRYQFPSMERGSRRPDTPPVAHAAVRAAVAVAARRLPHAALFAGGKSFGARMTSQAQAIEPLAGVRGLVFFGFPLHPAGQPSDERAAHLDRVQRPMLFLQGDRDALAEPAWLEPVIARLGPRATHTRYPAADHAFHVPARSGTTDDALREQLLDAAAAWMRAVAAG